MKARLENRLGSILSSKAIELKQSAKKVDLRSFGRGVERIKILRSMTKVMETRHPDRSRLRDALTRNLA